LWLWEVQGYFDFAGIVIKSGRSGGILLGIDLDTFDIGVIDEGAFYIKFHLCNKDINFKWALVTIYGPAQANLK
jgi:hypothetical protein